MSGSQTHESTTRFSDRVADYVRYRPSYPLDVVAFLKERVDLNSQSTVADLGAGTGIWSRLMLDAGATVFAVEPNAPMREAANLELGSHSRFTAVNGSGEQTTLPEHSVDLVTAAQAFHWFDIDATRKECQRILKSKSQVALIFNERDTTSSPFLVAYEQLLEEFATDYQQVNHAKLPETAFENFYGGNHYEFRSFPNEQRFDYAGLEGRLRSSSYAPAGDHPRHRPMLKRLQDIFESHESGGQVIFKYRTLLYVGQLH